jgi:hypothetical protein
MKRGDKMEICGFSFELREDGSLRIEKVTPQK